MARSKDVSREDILDIVQVRMVAGGVHSFSARDVASEVGISSASLHYYFPTKDMLCAAVVTRERDFWNKRLSELAAEHEDWPMRRAEALRLLSSPPESGLLPALAASLESLPPGTESEVRVLHGNITGWLARFAAEGKRRLELAATTDPEKEAAAVLGEAMGLVLAARFLVKTPVG